MTSGAASTWNSTIKYTPPGGSQQYIYVGSATNTSISVPQGTVINQLTATQILSPSTYAFSDWSGSYSSTSETAYPGATVNGPYSIAANYQLTTSTTSTSTSTTSTSTTICYESLSTSISIWTESPPENAVINPGPGTFCYAQGAQVDLTAQSSFGGSTYPNYPCTSGDIMYFSGWTGSVGSSQTSITVTMNSDITEIADYYCQSPYP